MATEVLNRKFVCTESDFGNQGHNKVWQIIVEDDGSLTTEYGRVGDNLQSTTKNFGSKEAALDEAERLINKKLKGKKKSSSKRESVYTEVEIVGTIKPDTIAKAGVKSIGKSMAQLIANGKKEIEDLITLLDTENIHNVLDSTSLTYDKNTGLFSTPLGVVGQKNIDAARDVLVKLKPFVEKDQWSDKTATKLVEQYMMLIPQNIGRQRPSLEALFYGRDKKIDYHSSILDSLQASLDILNKPKDTDDGKDTKNPFDISIDLVADKKEIKRITEFFESNKKQTHTSYRYKVDTVYSITIKKMKELFENKGKRLGGVIEVWHGTRVSNILSILAKGFFIPPANASYCCGRMFGNGLYFSDQSTKSLNYSQGYWSGTREKICMMFLLDVAMGKEYVPKSSGESLPKKGYDSTFAKGGQSGVINNEMIVYDPVQCNPKYLISFKE